MNVTCQFCGALHWMDEKTADSSLTHPRFPTCCRNTSLGVREDRLVNQRGGWVFRICGELCHLLGSLRPDHGTPPAFAQLYIYDPHLALCHRMHRNSNLREDTMSGLQHILIIVTQPNFVMHLKSFVTTLMFRTCLFSFECYLDKHLTSTLFRHLMKLQYCYLIMIPLLNVVTLYFVYGPRTKTAQCPV